MSERGPDAQLSRVVTVKKPLNLKKGTISVIDNIQIGNLIGKGAFGSVYKGLDSSLGQLVAIKRLPVSNNKAPEQALMTEISLLRNLDHKNIVKYISVIYSENHINFIMEFVEGGSLRSLLENFGSLTEPLTRRYIQQTLEGLEYLHSKNIIHCDIKAANLLMTKDGVVKIADFGISLTSEKLENPETNITLQGSPYWLSPEVIQGLRPDISCDVWSVGCTVIELLTGSPPYFKQSPVVAMLNIVKDGQPPLPPDISPEIEYFLRKCFQKSSLRSTATELLQDNWILSQSLSESDLLSLSALQTFAKKIISEEEEEKVPPSASTKDSVIDPSNSTTTETESPSPSVEISVTSTSGDEVKIHDITNSLSGSLRFTAPPSSFTSPLEDDTERSGLQRSYSAKNEKTNVPSKDQEGEKTKTSPTWTVAAKKPRDSTPIQSCRLSTGSRLSNGISSSASSLPQQRFEITSSHHSFSSLSKLQSGTSLRPSSKIITTPIENLSSFLVLADHLLAGSSQGSIFVIHTQKGIQLSYNKELHYGNVNGMVYLDDLVWSCGSDCTLKIWRTNFVNSLPSKSGWLTLEEHKVKSGVVVIRKKHWFSLREQTLSFYRTEKEEYFVGELHLGGSSELTVDKNSKKKYSFFVSCQSGEGFVVVQASSVQDMSDWMRAIYATMRAYSLEPVTSLSPPTSRELYTLKEVNGVLVTGSTDMTIDLWNIKNRSHIRELKLTPSVGRQPNQRAIWRIFPLPELNSVFLLIGHFFFRVHPDTFEVLSHHKGHTKMITGVLYTHQELWTVSNDKCIRVWDPQSGECKEDITVNGIDKMMCLAGIGGSVWVGLSSGIILVYDVQTKQLVKRLEGHTDAVLEIVSVGYSVYSVGRDSTIIIWQ